LIVFCRFESFFELVNAAAFRESRSLTVSDGQQYTITQGRDVRLFYDFPGGSSSASILLPRSTDGAVFGDICRVQFTANKIINVKVWMCI
jgi:hypothetical protein